MKNQRRVIGKRKDAVSYQITFRIIFQFLVIVVFIYIQFKTSIVANVLI